MIARHHLGFALLILVTLVSTPVRAADQRPFERDVIVEPGMEIDGSPVVLWVAWDLLDRADAETQGELFLTPGHVEAIRSRVLDREPRSLGCKPAIEPMDSPSPELARPLLDVFVHNRLLAIAEVERLQPGWNVFAARVETQVYARITEVLTDSEERLLPGDLVTFLDPSGVIPVAESRLCTSKPEGSYVPAQGDMIAFVGTYRDPAEAVPFVLTCETCVFAVRGDKNGLEILPNPPFGVEGEELRVDDLRTALAQR